MLALRAARRIGIRQMATKAALVKSLAADQKALADAVTALGASPSFDKIKALSESDAYAPMMEKVKAEDLSWTWSMLESAPSKPPVTVAVSGGGAVGAAALYRIAAGEMLGPDQPVTINVFGADAGVIDDVKACGFPLLTSITSAGSESAVMGGAAYALLLGGDFAALGKAAPKSALVAALGCKGAAAAAAGGAKVTGITSAGKLAAEVSLATAAGVSPSAVEGVVAWGDGVTDISHATVGGKWALKDGSAALPDVGEISVGIQADAAVAHMSNWALGSGGSWVSMGVPAVGDYGMGEGFFYSVPCVCVPGEYKRVGGVTMTAEVAAACEAERAKLAK